MIDDGEEPSGAAHPLRLRHHALRIGHHADDVKRHDVVERVVGERQVEGIALLQRDVTPAVPVHPVLRALEHLGRQIDARHLAVVRIRIERQAGADADLEDARARLDAERADHPDDPRDRTRDRRTDRRGARTRSRARSRAAGCSQRPSYPTPFACSTSASPPPPRLAAAEPARRRGRRRHAAVRASELPLEGGDVSPAEPPLPAALEGRQHALARQLVHGVGAEVEDLRDLLAVQQHVFLVQHGLADTTRPLQSVVAGDTRDRQGRPFFAALSAG